MVMGRCEIKDINAPEWEVVWGCGIIPQNCLLDMGNEINGDIIAHFPGGMLVCDLHEEKVVHPN